MRTRSAIQEAVMAVARKPASNTTKTIGRSSWSWIGHLMPDGLPESAVICGSVVFDMSKNGQDTLRTALRVDWIDTNV